MKRTMLKEKKAVVEEALQLVTFRIGTETYGLDIRLVSEVIRPIKIIPLPHMPRFVEGVIDLRGTVIPVVDLRKRFFPNTGEENRRTVRIMVIRGAVAGAEGRDLLGLVVDEVNDVLSLPLGKIEAAPEAAVGENAELIRGMGRSGELLIILLDITKILSKKERTELAEAQAAEPERPQDPWKKT